MGHGFLKQPRLLELQYFRITRYIEVHGDHGVAPPDVFTDLSSRSSSSGPQTIEELPALVNLLERIRAKAYDLVFIDVEHGSFGFDPVALIRPHLERAGAKVLNVFYDDDKILEGALKERFGKGALIETLLTALTLYAFSPVWPAQLRPLLFVESYIRRTSER